MPLSENDIKEALRNAIDWLVALGTSRQRRGS